jgi:beta-barrel assembly-enhancing protease
VRHVSRIVRVWLTAALLSTLAAAFAVSAATPEQDVEFASRDAELYFQRAGLLVDDPEASAYLQGVLQRLVDAAPDASLSDCRAFLIRGARASGFALPSCRVYLSTALFLALDNEQQLAAVMARELAHVQLHSVVNHRRALTKQLDAANFFSNMGAALGGFRGPGAGANMTDAVGDLIWRVSVRGFSPEIELRADQGALARLAAAKIGGPDAIRAIERLRVPAESPTGVTGLPLLASRNVLDARVELWRRLSRSNSEGAAPPSAEHSRLASRFRVDQIRMLVESDDLLHARVLLDEQVAVGGDNGVLSHLDAELQRRGGAAPDVMLAAYEKGAQFADAPAQLFLSQGMLLRELGHDERARQAFRRFLELAPASTEAALVKYYLDKPGAPQ